MALARNHHFLPQGYLRQFTDSGTRQGRVHVFDLTTGKSFCTNPRNIAAQKDFNRVEVEGQPPDFLETQLAGMEDKAVSVIRDMTRSNQIAKDDDLVWVINLVALLLVRNPRARESLRRAKVQTAMRIGQLLVSDQRIYENHLRGAREAGHFTGSDVPFERIKRFVDGGEYTIEVEQHALIRTEMSAFDGVLNTIGRRVWSLLTASKEAPDFVTCDHPVTTVYKDRTRGGPIGVGLPHTELVFPIGPRHALYSVFEDPLRPVVPINARGVAAMNARVVAHADRQVYARTSTFRVRRNGETVTVPTGTA
jgi:hypothetical protein